MMDDARSAVVVNADDFGISAPVNDAVLGAFERGWISSASLMANMPGFGQACAMIREHALGGRIGIHLNLSEGHPLTSAIRDCARVCGPRGELHMKPSTRFRLSGAETRAIEDELQAQIAACLRAGVAPTHLDSHGHTHSQWPVGTLVLRLARHYGVPAVRLSRNCGPAPSIPKRLYKLAFNARLARAGVARVRWFGSATDAAEPIARNQGPVEIMVHPAPGPQGVIVDSTPGGGPLEAIIRRLGIAGRMRSYGELCRTTVTEPGRNG